jgi:hypothetical protein
MAEKDGAVKNFGGTVEGDSRSVGETRGDGGLGGADGGIDGNAFSRLLCAFVSWTVSPSSSLLSPSATLLSSVSTFSSITNRLHSSSERRTFLPSSESQSSARERGDESSSVEASRRSRWMTDSSGEDWEEDGELGEDEGDNGERRDGDMGDDRGNEEVVR